MTGWDFPQSCVPDFLAEISNFLRPTNNCGPLNSVWCIFATLMGNILTGLVCDCIQTLWWRTW